MKTVKHKLRAGSTKTIYSHINGKGYVYYNIVNRAGDNSAKFWWIKGPFGNIEKIGTLSGKGRIKIQGSLWGRLRIGNLKSETVIQIHDDPRVKTNFPEIKF